MKITFRPMAVFVCLAVALPALGQPARTDIVPADSEAALQLAEVGDHHRVWQRVTVETDKEGNTITRTNAAYTELETGMNVRQPDGSYIAASDEIEIVKDGAVARKGRHQVSFAVNCNSPVAVRMLTADGKLLESRILGLAFTDKSTGKSVLIAEIKDSDGQLLMDAKNEVIYYDAFTDFKADVRYKNSKAGLEQDIILRENPPSPADYDLNTETTVLEALTEFFNPPVPEKKLQITDGTVNEFLDFGDLKMGNGRVYVMGKEATEIPVTKQWSRLDGRSFLIEEIPFTKVEPELQTLPKGTASVKPSTDGVRHQVSIKRLLPTVKQAKKSGGPMRLASAPLSGKGVVLDYVTASSATNYTFKCDSTYYVSGTVNLSGTNTYVEGGTVIKYAPTNTPKLNITSPITWLGSVYRPVIMTARDDSTVGEGISGSTGNPNTNYFASPALYIDGTAAGTNAILQNLRISYAQSGIVFNGKTGHVVSHAQLINCANGITATNAEFSLRNALLYKVLTNFNGSTATGRCEHLTVNIANWLNKSSAITLTLTNSLLAWVTNTGTFTSNYVSTVTSTAFQTVGAASHYLATTSVYRDAGTTNINASLATDLKKLTTYPPLVVAANYTVNTVLSPQAQRDTDLPDYGYHYDPLDYVVSGRSVTNSATLTLTNGVALGTYGDSSTYGLGLSSGSFVSVGSPANLNWIARYNTVQEQSTTSWSASSVGWSLRRYAASVTSDIRFTGFSLLAGVGTHYYDNYGGTGSVPLAVFRHSRFGGGQLGINSSGACTVALTNCLLERVSVSFNDTDPNPKWYLFNNLFYGGSLSCYAGSASTNLLAYDNLFDRTTISSTAWTNNYNGYVTNQNRLSPNGANDVILTNTPIYQTSYLGRYYYPTSGGLLSRLLDVGSRTAPAATLYHFTTATDQTKETTSTVDIGYHYVATDANGIPIDTDSDALPDYLEDGNGNGAVNSGETNWNDPSDFGLRVIITEPKRAANLP